MLWLEVVEAAAAARPRGARRLLARRRRRRLHARRRRQLPRPQARPRVEQRHARSSSSPPTASSARADREHEPDLFWALRGGGGDFGVVTAIELELFPIARGVRRRPLVADRARRARCCTPGRELTDGRAARRADDGRPAPAASAAPGDPGAGARQVVRDRRGDPRSATRARPTSCSRRCGRSARSTTRSRRSRCRR